MFSSEEREQVIETICEHLIEGMSLVKICAMEGMPNRATILRWWDEEPEYAARCARARSMQADLMDDMIKDEADGCTVENFQAARVKIAAYQWRAAKLAPKKYGDKIDHTHRGDADAPIKVDATLSPAEAYKKMLGGS